MSKKYPRTSHFQFSLGATNDDRIMSEQEFQELEQGDLIFTEKLDGSNVCLTSEEVFSRSHASAPTHLSFAPLKKLHSQIAYRIPDGMSVFGEWTYAIHSIEYSMMTHPLNIFGIRDDNSGEWWSWNDVEEIAKSLGVPTVPVLLRGPILGKNNLQKIIEILAGLSSVYGPIREGLVVRYAEGVFDDGERLQGAYKWVRANHVQTTEHWSKHSVKKQPTLNIV